MLARCCQRQAGEGAYLQLELADVAAVDRPVGRVVWSRCHLIGHQAAIGQHEELDTQHADIVHCFGQRRGGLAGQGLLRDGGVG